MRGGAYQKAHAPLSSSPWLLRTYFIVLAAVTAGLVAYTCFLAFFVVGTRQDPVQAKLSIKDIVRNDASFARY